MNFNLHPVRFVESLAKRYGEDVELSFSRYFYRPNSVFDERFNFHVRASDVTEFWLRQQLTELPEGWELAFNSKLKDSRGRTFHVGLVDFHEGIDLLSVEVAVRRLLGDEALRSLWLFNSGRSFHGYIEQLMIPKEWREFLGRLLLMNGVATPQVVDSRWIGHRLIGGYCALRWSMNTSYYKQMPYKV